MRMLIWHQLATTNDNLFSLVTGNIQQLTSYISKICHLLNSSKFAFQDKKFLSLLLI